MELLRELWNECQSRYGLSTEEVSMAMELGLNPRKLGPNGPNKLDRRSWNIGGVISKLYVRFLSSQRVETFTGRERRRISVEARRAFNTHLSRCREREKKERKRLRKKQARQSNGSKQLDPWANASKRYKLSPEHIKMAKQLNLNPKKFSGYAPSKSQPWKKSIPKFIEQLHEKEFHKSRRKEA